MPQLLRLLSFQPCSAAFEVARHGNAKRTTAADFDSIQKFCKKIKHFKFSSST